MDWRLRGYLWFAGIVTVIVIALLEAVFNGG